ncbi:MAG TPA: NADH-quinone oxidoreductase subunit NuoB [Polyangiaceae bacterium]|nr:NADH-quinone oxidoreductase subunit NuoB [Polyangiaceae bacterium]
MFDIFAARLKQGFRTGAYPRVPPELPDRFRGLPVLDSSRCPDGCFACAQACPTDAIHPAPGGLSVDLGRCLFCSDCMRSCPVGAISHSTDHRLATRSRQDLLLREGQGLARASALDEKMRRLFGRSLKLRQVSAGGCNACEADINVLGTVVFDLGRFGIQVVASPRHADGLLITGPVTANMQLALKKTYDAVPAPKIVIAVGACAISGGPYVGHPEVVGGADGVVPVDLYIPGCPPHPYTILDGLLRLLGRLERDETTTASWSDRLRAAAVETGEANIREVAQAGRTRANEAVKYLGASFDDERATSATSGDGAPERRGAGKEP